MPKWPTLQLLLPKGAAVIQPLVASKAKIRFFVDQAAVSVQVWATC